MTNSANIQFQDFKVTESIIKYRESGKFDINIEFNPKAVVYESETKFVLDLDVQIIEENEKFLINLATVSTFTYDKSIPLENYINSLFIINAPAIVFPYLRAFISTLTLQSGMPPLVLPTLNLTGIGENLKRNIQVL